jgi:alkylation response protein AidB-like acyl-CoA dehydrogenase
MTAPPPPNFIPNDPVTVMRLLNAATIKNPEPGFMKSAAKGDFEWNLLYPFPRQDPADKVEGELLLQRQAAFLLAHIHPTRIDVESRLPPDYVELVRAAGLQKLMLPKYLGGDGVSPLNMARFIQLTASWSVAVAMSLSVNNYLGAPSYAKYIADTASQQKIADEVVKGAISGIAAVETQGASNPIFQTTAVPNADGSAYIINGTKVYIGNGPLADLLVLPCTTFSHGTYGETGISVFILDTRQPGFSVASPQTYMGLHGLANAVLEFKNCVVPATQRVGDLGTGLNVIMANQQPNRMFITAIALATSQLCLTWLRAYCNRMYMQQPLSTYQAPQATMAAAAAKVFAQDSVMAWTTLTQMTDNRDIWNELTAIKAWSTECMWSVIDSTLSLIAGPGYETATSKANRGVDPIPIERFYRDVRVTRIFGTTNELMLLNLGVSALPADSTGATPAPAPVPPTKVLSPANRTHLENASALAAQIATTAQALVTRCGGSQLMAMIQQPVVIEIGRALSLVWAMGVTLSRVESEAGIPTNPGSQMQDLADVFCTEAERGVAASLALADAWQPELSASVSAALMRGTLQWLTEGIIPEVPKA